MGATYTRQSTITDGAVIEASHFNDEYNQLLAAFAASTGHTHDGTAAEGGPITKLLGNTLTFGAATAGTDITITFDGETSDGVFKWMEDEDYFEFSDDLLVASTEKLQFRDTAIYINSSADGQLDLVADTEIQIAATTIDINGAVALNGAITGATNITLSGELDAATLDISGNADIDGTLEADAITINGTGIGSIYQVLAGSSDTVTTGALNSGSITSGFGTIDTGSSTITTTGLISGGSLDIDNVLINGTTIGHTDDTDLMTLTSGVLTVAGEVDATSLDISGNADIDGTLETDALSINGTTITSTATEINILDGDNSASTVTIADADRIILNDGGTMKQVAVSALNTYTSSSIAADDIGTGDAAVTIATSSGNITIDAQAGDADIIFKGTDSSSDITALTLDMSAAGAATFNDKIIATELDISGNVDIDGTLEADAITVNGATLAETISDTVGAMVTSNTESGITVAYDDADNTLDFTVGTLNQNTTGTAATVTGAAQSNITSLGTLTTLTVDNVIVNGTTIGHTDDTDLITLADGIATVAGEISVTTLDIGGTNVTSTAAELNLLDGVSGLVQADLTKLAAVDSTAAELNIVDGGTSATSTTLADADRLVTNDNGTMVQVALSDVKTYLTSAGFSSEDPTALAIALG
jgi:cytoskeletal protein CcmA (bactofilin family)